MTEFYSSRSRRQNFLRCPRARYWLDEAQGTGFSPVRVAVPLATGGSAHEGLASLMDSARLDDDDPKYIVDNAVKTSVKFFQDECRGRDLDIDELESQSFVYNEQLALTEGLVRLAGLKVIPRLLKDYDILEVEKMDKVTLAEEDSEVRVIWRSIPDALMRHRDTGDLYILSWKTAGQYSEKKAEGRIDMQGLSEAWAWETALKDKAEAYVPSGEFILDTTTPRSHRLYPSEKIRGIQMVYLVKGQRRQGQDGTYQTSSDLIRGYRRQTEAVTDPIGGEVQAGKWEFATDLYYTCTEPHSFRYAKGGVCPGGKNHKRSGEWERFNAWETDGGVKAWMELLDRNGYQGELDVLDKSWAMPVPYYRTRDGMEHWLQQTKTAELQTAHGLLHVRRGEEGARGNGSIGYLLTILDVYFPQNTEKCNDWFGRRCPAWDLCHGPSHVAADPVGSGLYRIKPQYETEATEVEA